MKKGQKSLSYRVALCSIAYAVAKYIYSVAHKLMELIEGQYDWMKR